MTNVTLTISDPDGGSWSVDLGPELYALLVATSQRSAAPAHDAEMRMRPAERSTPAAVAAAALERSLLQGMDDGEGTGSVELARDALRLLAAVPVRASIDAALAAEVELVLRRARAAGLDWPGGEEAAATPWLAWQVHGVISYSLSRETPDETAVVDMTVSAPDWHAAETAAVEKVRAALELDDDTPFPYSWASGPDVTPLGEDEPGGSAR
ncbi:MAG: hypothetical protein RLZZ387_3893 [Chloroflexota bacterium]|jgi:hypothetical protein